ncbi:chaplin family protein [Streptomyces sp. Ac-502]|uniref:chaplin n=1 Tax=Streptomyces sp. Ac-502 TaxID=3342801 RepID=UPI003862C5E0
MAPQRVRAKRGFAVRWRSSARGWAISLRDTGTWPTPGAHADSGAVGRTAASPGVLAGDLLQAPAHVPVNVCGDTVNVIGLLNPAFVDHCANPGSHHHPPGHEPPGHKPPGQKPPGHKPPGHRPPGHEVPGSPVPGHRPRADVAGNVDIRTPPAASPAGGKSRETGQAAQGPALARTGSDRLGAAAAMSGALLLGAVALVHRSRNSRAWHPPLQYCVTGRTWRLPNRVPPVGHRGPGAAPGRRRASSRRAARPLSPNGAP